MTADQQCAPVGVVPPLSVPCAGMKTRAYLRAVAAQVDCWRAARHNRHTVLHIELVADMVHAALTMMAANESSDGELQAQVAGARKIIAELVGMLCAELRDVEYKE